MKICGHGTMSGLSEQEQGSDESELKKCLIAMLWVLRGQLVYVLYETQLNVNVARRKRQGIRSKKQGGSIALTFPRR